MQSKTYETAVLCISIASIIASIVLKSQLWLIILLFVFNTLSLLFFTLRREKISIFFIIINLAQIMLFYKMFYLINNFSQTAHYSFTSDLQWLDWLKFTFAHIAYAVDFLDIIDAYHLSLMKKITHQSFVSSITLAGMYISINICILKIIFNMINQYAFFLPKGKGLKWLRFLGLTAAFVSSALYAWKNHWYFKIYISWFLEHALFAIDFADILQIFKLKSFPENTDNTLTGLGLLLRFVICSYTIVFINKLYSKIIKSSRSVKELAKICESLDYPVYERIDAVKRLAKYGKSANPAVPQLIKVMADSSHKLRYTANEALEKINPDWHEHENIAKSVSFLLKRLNSNDKSICIASVKTLGKTGKAGERAIPALIKMLKTSDGDLKRAASEALTEIGSQAIPSLIRMLINEDKNITTAALETLEQIDLQWNQSEKAKNDIIRFAKMTADSKGPNRTAAARALEKIKPALEEIVPYMLNALQDNAVRLTAIKILGHTGSNANQAIPQLINILSEEDIKTRNLALEALNKIDPEWQHTKMSHKAIINFIQCLTQGKDSIFAKPDEALATIGLPAIPYLVKALVNTDKNLQAHASQILKKIDPKWAQTKEALETIDDLVKALSDNNWYIRNSAAKVIATIGTGARKAAPALIKGLADSNRTVKDTMKKALDRVMVKNQELLDNDKENEKISKKDSLWPALETDKKDVIQLLEKLKDSNAQNRIQAVKALGFRPKPAVEAIPHLIFMLADIDRNVRIQASDALDNTDPKWMYHEYVGTIVPLFIKAMADREAESPYALPSQALITIGNGAIEYLLILMADKNKAIANTAGPVLEQINPEWAKTKEACRAVEGLSKKLSAQEWFVRKAAARTLGKIGTGAVKAVPHLVKGLSDKNKNVRDTFKDAMDKILLKK